MTSLSSEQVIIFQLHGSTASLSQFSSTLRGSISEFLILIKACTEKIRRNKIIDVKTPCSTLLMMKKREEKNSSYLQSWRLWERAKNLRNSISREKPQSTEQLPFSVFPLNSKGTQTRKGASCYKGSYWVAGRSGWVEGFNQNQPWNGFLLFYVYVSFTSVTNQKNSSCFPHCNCTQKQERFGREREATCLLMAQQK